MTNHESELKKWDEIYATSDALEEDEAMRIFNNEFATEILKLLPEGGRTLEVGSGGGWQSLALARTKKFQTTLMDFSKEALNYSRKIFERENLTATFLQRNAFENGTAEFDLVFNAGVLEHYTFDEQVSMIKAMASYSKKFVMVLVPNSACFWYWIWRAQITQDGGWKYGVENPLSDLSKQFETAGVHFIGVRYFGKDWAESFITNLHGIDEQFKNLVLDTHRSGLFSERESSYLLAGLGVVDEQFNSVVDQWAPLGESLKLNEGSLQARVIELSTQIKNLEKDSLRKAEVIQEKEKVIAAQLQVINRIEEKLNEIYSSNAWKLIRFIWGARVKLLPDNSVQMKFVQYITKTMSRGAKAIVAASKVIRLGFFKILRQLTPKKLQVLLDEFNKQVKLPDRSRVAVYAPPEIFPAYPNRLPWSYEDDQYLRSQDLQVSLIATVLNEASRADEWLDSLLQQTTHPSELIIVDGGSTDKTVELLHKFAKKAPFRVKILIEPGVNIAKGRNIAIQNSSSEIIACSDFGCILEKKWLENLIKPFLVDSTIHVSFGFSRPVDDTSIYAKILFSKIDELDPQSYLPSSRNLAFRKSVWEKVNGYPEWLTDAGEDTLFDLQIKSLEYNWCFTPEATVSWHGPANKKKLLRLIRRYATGDGEAGIFSDQYRKKFYGLLKTLFLFGFLFIVALVFALLNLWMPLAIITAIGLLAVVLKGFRVVYHKKDDRSPSQRLSDYFSLNQIRLAQVEGFIAGIKNRPTVEQRQADRYIEMLEKILANHPASKGVVIYPPTHDWGYMFQRPHQIAREFARQGYLFFYCTKNEMADTVYGFTEIDPGLYLCNVPTKTFSKLKSPVLYLGVAKHAELIKDLSNPLVIYDHYDDLAVSSTPMKMHLAAMRAANIVITTSDPLLKEAQKIRSDILLIPNGVDYDFVKSYRDIGEESAPTDLEAILAEQKPIIGYSGALAEWFDYGLVDYLAKQRQEWNFVILGTNYDGTLDKSNLLANSNIYWLGMKKYEDLFHYIRHFSVGIIPFHVNEITLATSPLKLFEYAALLKPIITTALPECTKYDEVLIAKNKNEFLSNIEIGLVKAQDPEYIRKLDLLAQRNSWESKVKLIISEINRVSKQDTAP